METTAGIQAVKRDRAAWELFEFLREKEDILGLEEAQFYHDFPVLKDLDDDVVISKILILSREHGVVIISTSNVSSEQIAIDELRNLEPVINFK